MEKRSTTFELRPYGPGKFDFIVDSVMYQASLDGADDEIITESATYTLMRDPYRIDPEHEEQLTEDELSWLYEQAAVILREDHDGFVAVRYISEEEQESAPDQIAVFGDVRVDIRPFLQFSIDLLD